MAKVANSRIRVNMTGGTICYDSQLESMLFVMIEKNEDKHFLSQIM